ncbi:MAG: rRNA maturation RNase YbeY [Thermoguttaceae bacterium]
MISIRIANQQTLVPLDRRLLRRAASAVLRGESIRHAKISLAVVDDAAIRPLNRRYLGHDFATDVLSFLFDRDDTGLDGEIVVSAETAWAAAQDFGCPPGDELLLYVVHGMLHLAGYDDRTPHDRAAIQERESYYLARLGIARAGEPTR